MQLSPHFTLAEMVRTSHRSVDNWPPRNVIEKLQELAQTLLEPIREKFGALYVTSGYRCPTLNVAIGGATDSAHLYGCAADLVPASASLEEVMRWVAKDSGLPFDQAIIERSSTAEWLHIGMLRPHHEKAPRREALRFDRGVYTPWKGVA